MNPKVSFIVPCYRLAHYLPDCVNSILVQTFGDFEILIMDDCSPDDTPEIARAFDDPRIRYERNEVNLGNVANYNKGIGLARGEFIWLISADDELRCPYVLERYVQTMERFPRVGYIFCPVVELRDGKEFGMMRATYLGPHERIYRGNEFFDKIVRRRETLPTGEERWFTIEAPSVMVRRSCYEMTLFPGQFSHAGDRYIWGIFALHYDVAYLSEPMVRYRVHSSSMMNQLIKNDRSRKIFEDETALCWRLRRRAEALENFAAVESCNKAITGEYIRWLCHMNDACVPLDLFEDSLRAFSDTHMEELQIKGSVCAEAGDFYFWHGDVMKAQAFYRKGLWADLRTLRPRFFLLALKLLLSISACYVRPLMKRVPVFQRYVRLRRGMP